jgi:biotin carboxylase
MSPRPRVLLLMPTTSYRADDFLAAAARLGIEVLVATDRCHVLAQDFTEAATGSIAIELRPPEAAVASLCALHRQRPFAAIVPVDDATTVVAARASAALGLPHNPVDAVVAARNKRALRQRLSEAGVAQPRFRLVPLSALPEEQAAAAAAVGLPCVLKPTVLSASQGVIRADDHDALHHAHRRIAALLRRPEFVAVHGDDAQVLLYESFIPGPEVAVEALLRNGQLEPLALFDKPDPLDGPFFEETLYVTPSRLDQATQRHLFATTAAAARALGLVNGPVHAELRLLPGGVPHVIEVAARSIGGLCSRTLRFGTGRSLEELILLHAAGLPIGAADLHREGAAAGVMMLPIPRAGVLQKVHGLHEARLVPGIAEVTLTARLSDELLPLPEGSAYLGFLFARGDRPETVEAALRKAHARLSFTIASTLPVRPAESSF